MIYAFGPYELDTGLYELRNNGEPCRLEPQVFDVLAYLVENRGRVVTKEELLDKVWSDRFVTEASLSSRLMAARKAIGDSGREQNLIKTIHGRGYRFAGEVTVRDGSSRPAGAVPAAPQPPASHPSSRPAPIGREPEAAALRQALDEALLGRRRTVFVTGEPGLGKTTLVEDFLDEVRARSGIQIGHGQCLEHRGSGEPYMPVLEALTRMCREPTGTELISLLSRHAPTWLVQMPGLVDPEEMAALQQRTLGTTTERMLREMVEALDVYTAQKPLVLVLEDLHWSDHSTVDLISWLARRQEPARLLMIGTFRPADVRNSAHPLHRVAPELCHRGHATEVPLAFLTEQDAQKYLQGRLPAEVDVAGLAALLHRRTEGNPLFMSNVVDYWLEHGLVQADGELGAAALTAEVPDSLRAMIEHQAERLDAEHQRALQYAGAAGREFAAATVAAALEMDMEDVEEQLAELARRGQFLRELEPVEWQDGTISASFEFIHDLYREVIYDRVPPSRRARLHAAIGTRLEAAYGQSAARHAGELASHFVRGRIPERAVHHLNIAAEQALLRSAHHEALRHVNEALGALEALPEGEERDRLEAELLLKFARSVVATVSWADSRIDEAYMRARAVCERLGDRDLLSGVILGMGTMYEIRGEFAKAQGLMEELLQLGTREQVNDYSLSAIELLACSKFHQGIFLAALDHAEEGLKLYNPKSPDSSSAAWGDHPGISCHDWAALALWFLGFPDQARERALQAVELANEPGFEYALANAQAQCAIVHQVREEPEEALRWAESTIATGKGFPYRIVTGTALRGWALAALGRFDEGVSMVRHGIASSLEIGAGMDHPYFLALLADACSHAGAAEQGLEAVTEALDRVRRTRSFFYEAELHRIRGALLIQKGTRGAVDEAERAFRKAIEVARDQGARSLELRAATSLFKLPQYQRMETDAAGILATAYDSFTEGYDTIDLRRAASLLGRPPAQRTA